MLETERETHVRNLRSKDANSAYASLQALEAESRDGECVYPYFDCFAAMLGDPSGYVRIRGIRLIAANARWAEDERLKAVLPELLGHILDPKPIVARQCISRLPEIAAGRPPVAAVIGEALRAAADPSCYADTMAPLVTRDIAAALKEIEMITTR